MPDKQSLLQRLNELSFPQKEYWVVAGSAMVLHGFRSQTHDIDLGCSILLADKLERQGYCFNRKGAKKQVAFINSNLLNQEILNYI